MRHAVCERARGSAIEAMIGSEEAAFFRVLVWKQEVGREMHSRATLVKGFLAQDDGKSHITVCGSVNRDLRLADSSCAVHRSTVSVQNCDLVPG